MLKDGDGSCHLRWQVDGTAILEAENKPYGRHCGLSLNLKVSLALLYYQITINACELLAHHQTQPFALPFSSQRANLCHRCHSSSIYPKGLSIPATHIPPYFHRLQENDEAHWGQPPAPYSTTPNSNPCFRFPSQYSAWCPPWHSAKPRLTKTQADQFCVAESSL